MRGAHTFAVVTCLLGAIAGVATQESSTRAPVRFPGLPVEASGVVYLPGSNGALIVADGSERQAFWMALDPTGASRPLVGVPLAATIPDPEDITTDGAFVYIVGSQSRGAGRNVDGLVRFRFDPSTRRASQFERVRGLGALLNDRVPDLARLSKGRSGPLNIEGLTWDGARRRLLLGLRSPLDGRRALMVEARLSNPALPLSAANLQLGRQPIAIDLGGLAIRGLGYDESTGRVLIIGGGATNESDSSYRLFDWDGVAPAARDLGGLRSQEKPEGVTRATIGGRTRTLLVFDLGGYQVID